MNVEKRENKHKATFDMSGTTAHEIMVILCFSIEAMLSYQHSGGKIKVHTSFPARRFERRALGPYTIP